jgi:hypothetical protein
MVENVRQGREGRRLFLRNVGFVAGAGIIGAVVSPALAKPKKSSDTSSDVNVMQGALALEHEGIAAYEIAGHSGLLRPPTLKLALLFQSHHKQHRDALADLIKKAGGAPVTPKTDAEYTKELDLGALKTEADVVALATKLELGATNAYTGQVAALRDHQLAHLFTQLATDETVHWTTLNNAAGTPIPQKAFLFG